MAAKIAAAVLVVLALASAGTVGVAYYNDPTIFDSSVPGVNQCPSMLAEPSCCSDTDCCDQVKPDCGKPNAESGAPGK